jgi:hypothetical protein
MQTCGRALEQARALVGCGAPVQAGDALQTRARLGRAIWPKLTKPHQLLGALKRMTGRDWLGLRCRSSVSSSRPARLASNQPGVATLFQGTSGSSWVSVMNALRADGGGLAGQFTVDALRA